MRSHHVWFSFVSLLGVVLIAGCAAGRVPGSYLPVGASALYGDETEDGVVVMLRQDAHTALEAVRAALESSGYRVADSAPERLRLRTRARPLGGDTTIVVKAEVIPVELPEPAASIVLTATYSVPSHRIRDAPLVQRPGEVDPLFGQLRAIAETLRRQRAPAS